MNKLADEELMLMYQNGNALAFQIIYERHSSKIFGYLKKRIRQEEKVTEIFQDVFLKIHKSKHLYTKSLPLLPWLFTITRTSLLDYLKKDSQKHFIDTYDFEQIIDSTQASPESSPDSLLILKKLPPVQGSAIQLRYVDDKTFEEIAEILKTTPVNVRQIISRGLKRLKDLLSEGSPS